jgi:hypothetical protein
MNYERKGKSKRAEVSDYGLFPEGIEKRKTQTGLTRFVGLTG